VKCHAKKTLVLIARTVIANVIIIARILVVCSKKVVMFARTAMMFASHVKNAGLFQTWSIIVIVEHRICTHAKVCLMFPMMIRVIVFETMNLVLTPIIIVKNIKIWQTIVFSKSKTKE
jgi:hypothetical protein